MRWRNLSNKTEIFTICETIKHKGVNTERGKSLLSKNEHFASDMKLHYCTFVAHKCDSRS